MSTGFGIEDFRFSGSYVSRYHHCSGSAVLDEAIPGFKAVGGERAASTLGTRLHKVYERILGECDDWLEAAALLNLLADVWGAPRIKIITDPATYYTWWILELKNTEAPPIEHDIIALLHSVEPEWVEEDPESGATTTHPEKPVPTSPKLIRFLADAVRFMYELRDENAGARIFLEGKRTADWTATKPKTSADVVLTNGVRIDVTDLKTGTIEVEAAHNEQLLYYLQTYYEEETEMWVHIVQPGNVSSWQVPIDYLHEWAASVLRAEQRILNGDRTLNPGKHCQFCPANPFTKGERGTPSCPAQVDVLFGAEDMAIILEE